MYTINSAGSSRPGTPSATGCNTAGTDTVKGSASWRDHRHHLAGPWLARGTRSCAVGWIAMPRLNQYRTYLLGLALAWIEARVENSHRGLLVELLHGWRRAHHPLKGQVLRLHLVFVIHRARRSCNLRSLEGVHPLRLETSVYLTIAWYALLLWDRSLGLQDTEVWEEWWILRLLKACIYRRVKWETGHHWLSVLWPCSWYWALARSDDFRLYNLIKIFEALLWRFVEVFLQPWFF